MSSKSSSFSFGLSTIDCAQISFFPCSFTVWWTLLALVQLVQRICREWMSYSNGRKKVAQTYYTPERTHSNLAHSAHCHICWNLTLFFDFVVTSETAVPLHCFPKICKNPPIRPETYPAFIAAYLQYAATLFCMLPWKSWKIPWHIFSDDTDRIADKNWHQSDCWQTWNFLCINPSVRSTLQVANTG